jgi:hypothetical protein
MNLFVAKFALITKYGTQHIKPSGAYFIICRRGQVIKKSTFIEATDAAKKFFFFTFLLGCTKICQMHVTIRSETK